MKWWARVLAVAILAVGFTAQMALAGHAASCVGNPGPCDGSRTPPPAQSCIGVPGPCDGPRVAPPAQAVPIVVPEYNGSPVAALPSINRQHYVPVADGAYESRLTAEFCAARPELC